MVDREKLQTQVPLTFFFFSYYWKKPFNRCFAIQPEEGSGTDQGRNVVTLSFIVAGMRENCGKKKVPDCAFWLYHTNTAKALWLKKNC